MRRHVRSSLLFALLATAALSRLLLQILAMPPYAGLDEVFHCARFAFRLEEGRNPTAAENSVPFYLTKTTAGAPDAPPDFALLGPRWPAVARANRTRWPDPPVTPDTTRPYVFPNYEAQQPNLVYAALGPLARLLPHRTALTELMVWRAASALLALLAVLAAGAFAARSFGTAGLLAAAVLPLLPTWLTLVARAGNDAFACGFLALALCLSARKGSGLPGSISEGLAWAAALAAKLTTWPALVAVPFLWRGGRPDPRRKAIVGLICAAALASTILDLHRRTGISVGSQSFHPEATAAAPAGGRPIAWGAWGRVFIASAIWTAGQHGNALKPFGMALYVLPVAALLVAGLVTRRGSRTRRAIVLAGLILAAFGVAQLVNAAGFVRRAIQGGAVLPEGGAEGWYLYTQVTALVLIVSAALRQLTTHRIAGVALVVLLLAWDIGLYEGGLFRDWAGLTSPATPGLLLRWGADSAATGGLERLAETSASGTGLPVLIALRVAHVAATLSLLVFVLLTRPRGRPGARTATPATDGL